MDLSLLEDFEKEYDCTIVYETLSLIHIYNVGVPFAGKYKEIFNSDDKKYGGNGVVNTRVKAAKKAECDEREYSITEMCIRDSSRLT